MDNTAICLPADPDPDADEEMGKKRMIGDLISREALKRALEKRCRAPWWFIVGLDPALKLIETLPGETGEWVDMGDFEQCSNCKATRLKRIQTCYGEAQWIKPDFCPGCGADMREDSE